MTERTLDAESMLELVRRRFAERVREESGEELRTLESTAVIRRPYSVVLFLNATTEGGTRRVVLKQISDHPLNAPVVEQAEQAAVEFGVLARVHPQFTTVDRCSVPRPILMLPEINAYLMEFAEGDVLANQLDLLHYWVRRASFGRLERCFYDSGRWLRHFQEFTGRRLASASAIENVVVRCRDRLRLIDERSDPRIAREFCKRATELLERLVDRLKNAEIPVSGRHGDFGPWNIIGGSGGVTVLDFFGYREDPLPVDIVSMLVAIRSMAYNVANSAARVQELEKSFLGGLGGLPRVPQDLIVLCEAQQRVQHIAGAAIEEGTGFMRRLELTRSLRAHVKWILEGAHRRSVWLR